MEGINANVASNVDTRLWKQNKVKVVFAFL